MILGNWTKPIRGAQLNRSHPLARGLVGLYLFNEGPGCKTVQNLAVPGNEGTITATDFQTCWASSDDGGAVEIVAATATGVIECASLSGFKANKADDISAFVVYRRTGTFPTGYGTLLANSASAYNQGLYLLLTNDGLVQNFAKSKATLPSGWDSGWHAIGYCHCKADNHANDAFYYDGAPLVTQDDIYDAGDGQNILRIGKNTSNGHYFQGRITVVAVWNAALTAGDFMRLARDRYALLARAGGIPAAFSVPSRGGIRAVARGERLGEMLGMQA